MLGEFEDDPESWLPDHLRRYSDDNDSSEEYKHSDDEEGYIPETIDLWINQYHQLHDTWRINKTISHQKRIEKKYIPLSQKNRMEYTKMDVLKNWLYLKSTKQFSFKVNPEYEPYLYFTSMGFLKEIKVAVDLHGATEVHYDDFALRFKRKKINTTLFICDLEIRVHKNRCGYSGP